MPNDQPETPDEAKQVAASDGAPPPEAPPQAPADTVGPGDTESVPKSPDEKNMVSAAAEATLPPRSVQQTPSDESATLPPRSRADAPESRSGNQRVNEAACSRLEKSWFDGDPLSIETCLEHVPEPELPDTTEELVCIEMEFFWKQSVSGSQGDNTSDAESSDTESSAPTWLEDYLKRFPQLDTPQRMERLVSAEMACRLQIHAAIDPNHYRQRFPDLIADNSWVQQRVDAMQRLGSSGRRSSSDRTVTPARTAASAAEPGLRSFGDYELLQEIARGGMGVVYKARQTKLNRVVALKMILSGQLASQEDVQRFYVEAEAAASLEHPGIVPIHEIGEHDDQHFFSMGFIEGASLESQVKDGPLPPREAATVMQRVSEAIAYAHAQGVIHRDLKPANILIDTGGEPKVTDFGLAKKTEGDSGLTGTGQILGTPGYMPPEQASGETDTIGPAADIYSLGAILYALLTGRPPFQSATVMDTLVAVLEQEPVTPRQLNPALDVDLETICLKCLQKDIKRRYTTTDELVAELGRYLNGEPIHARPIGKLERGWRWCKRKPALAGMLGISAAALMTLVAGGLWYNAQLVQERDIAQRQRKLAEMREAEATLAQANEARQRERAEEQKEAAERNFKLARMAVDELTTVSQNELFDVPQMEPIRKALLEKARAFYETFVEQSTGDRDLMYELAKAHERLGSIIQQLGNPADAAAEYEKSRLAFSQLMNDHKDVPLYALDLAHSYNNLANTQSELGEKQRAIELYEKEILILNELWRDHPNVPDYAASLATSYNNLAIAHSDLGQVDKAVEWYNKALGIQIDLLKANPREGEYAENLARSYHNLGNQYGELGQNDRAIKLYTKAIQINETLFKSYPNVSKYADNLASTYFALACTQHNVGKTEKFFEMYRKAIPIRERLQKNHPDVPDYARSLADTYNRLGEVLYESGKKNEALELHKKAIPIIEVLVKDHSEVPAYADSLSVVYHELGRTLMALGRKREAVDTYRKAIVVREQLVEDQPSIPEYRDLLTRSYVNFGDSMRRVGETEQALGWLRKAVNTGELLAREHPDVPDYAWSLGGVYLAMGTALHGAGQLGQAIEQYNKSIQVHAKLVRDYPEQIHYLNYLLKSELHYAMALHRLRRFSQAIQHYEAALDLISLIKTKRTSHENLAGKKQMIDQRLDVCRVAKRAIRDEAFVLDQPPAMAARLLYLRGQVQLDEKKYEAAVETVDQSMELQFPEDQMPASARNFYCAACLLSLASDAVTRDERLTAAVRAMRVEQYAARAVELLIKAQQTGWFDDSANVIHLKKTDTDLDPLRQRDDFKQLVKELEEDQEK